MEGFISSLMIFEWCVQAASVLITSYILPVSHQIDIRTATFWEKYMCSENYICTLFENIADSNLKKIFSRARLSSCEVSLLLCVFCVSFS